MPTKRRLTGTLAIVATAAMGFGFSSSVPVQAQTTKTTLSPSSSIITATRPGSIVLVARGFGSADLGKDSDGNPQIEGRVNGYRYFIYFFGCTANKNCTDIQLASAFTPTKKPTVKVMNDYNSSFRFGQAWLDKEGDANIAISIEMDGGITKKNLEEWFKRWEKVLTDFTDLIGFK